MSDGAQYPHSPGKDSADGMKRKKIASPRAMAIFAALWLVVALGWLIPSIWLFSQGDQDYIRLGFGLVYLALAVVYLVMWRRAKRPASDSDHAF
jgi:uncharacterized membrane protein YfcA